MGAFGFAGFGFLLMLPILVGQWIGVVGIAGSGKTPAWWCMMSGTALTTLGSIASVLMMVMMFNDIGGAGGPSTAGIATSMGWKLGAGAFSSLGSVLFVIGFAIHGFQVRRIMGRITDLENIVAAQQEQASRDMESRVG